MFYHRVIPLKCALILCLIILFSNNDSLFVNGRRNGAPIESCITLKPRHGNNIQSQPKSTNPFLFNVTLYPYMNEEEFIHVEIHSHNDHQVFRGFIVQARMANNPEMIADGTFVPIDSNQTRSFTCNENNMEGNNTWTHSNSSPKKRVSAFWFPADSTMNNEILFLSTVAIDAKHFWLHIDSDKIPLGITVGGAATEGEEDNEGESGGDGGVEGVENGDDSGGDDGNGNENPSEDQGNENSSDVEEPQHEPSNNVESIVSSAFTINYPIISYSTILVLIISLMFYRILIF
ncbi:DOMON domain-containing protein frrs1L [Dermatophagoides farinae]|uniref:DOMON domain-containing protein frrs1L n=1 Tax=Dermatophagoides farinae TaxID=6954 RepID=A0A922ICN6_DERFA|nr:DOMON domain-containing protein frrs1L [Dermatophagoides farinae]